MGRYTQYAKEVFKIEAKSISDLANTLDSNFDKSIDAILRSKGRVIVTGVGKSGLIGRKISATLASTGTPSLFMHPVEAFHGDLGVVKKEDVMIAISYSGETEELLKLVPFIKANKLRLIGLSGNPKSTLALNSDYHLNVLVHKEACPLELAPTSSTTATLAMGDALAVALMKARNFKPEDFAQFHPGGTLGKKLLTTVEASMVTKDLPVVKPADTIQRVINAMSSGRLGLAVVLDKSKITGVITDGDLRRAMDRYNEKLFQMQASDIMTRNPRTISRNMMMAAAEDLMNTHKITSLLVAEKDKLVGVVQIYSLNRQA
jgi:arabinose-5-phosphate isomerase